MTKRILYFTAAWCGPCRMMGGVIEELNQTMNIQKIDVDKDSDQVKKYHIKSVPTFILVDETGEIKRVIGAQSKIMLEKFYNEMN